MGEFPVVDGLDPEELAQEISDHSQEHCDTMVTTRSERYMLESWIEARGSTRNHIVFLMTCNSSLTASIEPTEPSTEKGIVSQLMRQNEKKDQLLMGMFGHVTNSYGQLLNFVNTGVQLRTEAADDRFTNLKQKMEYEQFLHQQEIEKLEKTTALESKGKLIEMVKPAFGMLMGQVAQSFVKKSDGQSGMGSEQKSNPEPHSPTPNAERSDIYDLLDIVGELPSLAMVSGLSNLKLKTRVELIIEDYFHPTNLSTPTKWSISTLLDSAGYNESIKMAQSTGNEGVEVMMVEYINNHFNRDGKSGMGNEQDSNPKPHSPNPTPERKGQVNGESKEEDQQAQEQGAEEAEPSSNQKDASRARKVPSKAKGVGNRSKKAPKEGVEKAHKEDRKANGKANGDAEEHPKGCKANGGRSASSQEANRKKANSRWSKTARK